MISPFIRITIMGGSRDDVLHGGIYNDAPMDGLGADHIHGRDGNDLSAAIPTNPMQPLGTIGLAGKREIIICMVAMETIVSLPAPGSIC